MSIKGWMSVCAVAFGSGLSWGQRLPENVTPQHYTLAIAPEIAKATFSGTETIDVMLASASNTVTLNSLDLQIQSVTADGQPGNVSFDPSRQQATLTFSKALPAGHAALSLAFTGVLNDKLRGFYLSKTKTRNYAVTQFESTDARRAFPCFDEPAFKATFDVSLTVDARDTVISNTNMISDVPAGTGKHHVIFATTPRMSTYLVAYLVGDFACSKGGVDGVPIRVCSTPDKVKLTTFAVKAAEHFLHYYDDYFGIHYPMPKLDLIGIPDFEAGAMENFGAITYRETALLLDDKDASINSRKRVAETVAHEMAHQWFGDMVTMQWWDNLWLNEGFATWMEDKAADEWHPEWNFPQDVADSLNGTLNYDAGRTTHPIRQAAETPAEIAELFDGIAYGKAGAVIGMIENWVGPKVFQQGVHNYLAAHLYANATAEDFWNAQTAASKLPVDKVMSSFIDRPGVPLLTFGNKEDAGFPAAQSRFYLSGMSADERDASGVARGWTVPVCVKTMSAPQCTLLSKDSAALSLSSSTTLPFFYANAGQKGYYRVGYTPAQVKVITASVETGLSVPERIGFLGDRWALTRAGQGSVGEYLDLVLALKQDKNAEVLDAALSSIGQIRSKIADDDDRLKLNLVIQKQFGPAYAAMGAEEEKATYDQQQIRTELFEALGEADDPKIEAHALQVTLDYFSHKKVTEPDIVDASVMLTAEHGDKSFYEDMLNVSEQVSDPGLESETQELLTRFHDPKLVVRTLEYATSGAVRNQDSWILIALELNQRQSRDLTWAWIEQHWDKVQAQLTTASGGDLVAATGSFCTVDKRNEVATFFATHKVEAADRALAKALDSIDDCVRLRAAQEPKLKAWLTAHSQ